MPLLVVDGDPVQGTDTHNAAGQAMDSSTTPPAPVAWVGTGRYTYTGSVASGLSDLVRVGGAAAAITTSHSTLTTGEDVPPTGGHSGPAGSQFIPGPGQPPTAPTPIPTSLSITDPIGTGRPGAAAGSDFVRIGGDPILLDGDPFDTCDGTGSTGNSTVSAIGQDFVSVST